jgi:flagellar L-ring protein precursor FlgH
MTRNGGRLLSFRRCVRVVAAVLGPLLLAACDAIGHFQGAPSLSAPGAISGIPNTLPNSQPVAAARAGDIYAIPAMPGSLWRPGSKTFFRDTRARNVGDLVTVIVSLQDQAEFANQTQLQRTTANTMSITNLFGLGTLIGRLIPGLANTSPSISTAGSEQTAGTGDVKRSETATINFSATVVRVLPNGNFEIAGSQQVRLDNELRDLELRGIIRPEDILPNNTITSAQIAEARIIYGGHGVSSDLQRPPWGQDLLNRVQPF